MNKSSKNKKKNERSTKKIFLILLLISQYIIFLKIKIHHPHHHYHHYHHPHLHKHYHHYHFPLNKSVSLPPKIKNITIPEHHKENKAKLNSTSKPKISIVLPIYNKEDDIKRSIGCLQNQTLKDIEIIAVNDFSKDNTYNILKNLSLNDKRIKIVNNTKNSGLLYTRAMGIIHSKGDYIINLEPDDLLSNETDLEYLYSNTNNSQIDLINYNGFEISSDGYKKEQVYCTLYDEILYKTKLFDHFSRSPDFFIWNKMVKREIFLKAFDDYKHIIDRVYCNYAEDEIWSGLVNKYANSKRCLKRNVYLYIRNSNSLTMRRNNELYCDNLLQWNEMFVFKVFSEKKEMAKAQTIRFLDLIRDTYDYFNSIKSNKLLTEKYIKHLKSIKKEFIDDNLILDKINYLLDAFIPLINTNKKTIR